jgi:hypothetical protein
MEGYVKMDFAEMGWGFLDLIAYGQGIGCC